MLRIVGALAIRAHPMLGGRGREAEPSGRAGLGIAAACGDRIRNRIREPTAIHRKEANCTLLGATSSTMAVLQEELSAGLCKGEYGKNECGKKE
jgi:hypothetical protein